MPNSLPHLFAAEIDRLDDGFRYPCVRVPAAAADALDAAGVKRVVGAVNGHPFRRALQRRAGGERLLVFGQDYLRTCGATFGDVVTVELGPDPAPDRLDLGEAFEAVLAGDAAAAERFYALTPGRQRSLAYYVTSAKRPETREARALDLARKLRTHTLYGDLGRNRGEDDA